MKKELISSIEKHLGWGVGNSWTQKDFTRLSGMILETTGKQLSVTTLKRVWGRTETRANPSVTTFDILSEFIGFESWRDFQSQQQNGSNDIKRKGRRYSVWKWSLGVLGLVVLSLVIWSQGKVPTEPKKQIEVPTDDSTPSFELEKVATGYPNTVIFRYDYGNLDYDSISIQQSWDEQKRIPLKERKGLVTSTYYRPGYFLAKLIADGQILEERNLYIPTTGWQGMVIGDGKESYLKSNELNKKNGVGVSPQILSEMENTAESVLYLANLSGKPTINGTDFELATSFRMNRSKENSICQYIQMIITGTREVISLEFSKPGCVGDLTFFIDKEMVSGKDHDFSAFGRAMEEWTRCRVAVNKGLLKVFIEEQEVYSKELTVDLGKIGGVQWYFEGLGEINEMYLEDQDQKLGLL